MALFNKTVRAPRGVERVTRHALFVGVALLGAGHALLATRLVGTVLMGGLAVVAVAGAWHQDRKLLRQRGEPYAAYLEATSTVPFGAIVAGRQRLAWQELPVGALALGVVLAVLLRTVHGSIFAHGGAWVIAAVLGAAALGGVQSARRVRRRPLPSDGSLDSGSSSRSAGSCSGQLSVRSVAPGGGGARRLCDRGESVRILDIWEDRTRPPAIEFGGT